MVIGVYWYVTGPSSTSTVLTHYVGSLLASCITFGTANITGSWSWRIPCLLQSLFSIICAITLFFVPESPRWLIHQDRHEEAMLVMASVYADGETGSAVVAHHFEEILATIKWESESGQTLTYAQIFRTPNARMRVLLVISVALIATMSGKYSSSFVIGAKNAKLTRVGNNIISYYLGTMLTQAGITDSKTQLEIVSSGNASILSTSKLIIIEHGPQRLVARMRTDRMLTD